MSATINAIKFLWFFKGLEGKPAPYFKVGGALHPVKIRWLEIAASIPDYVQGTTWAVRHYHTTYPLKGNILAFLPGEDDIGVVAKLLASLDDLKVIPVYLLLFDE